VRVDDIQVRPAGEEVELSARVRRIPRGLPDRRIWYRFPAELGPALVERADPFLPALLFCAIAGREPLEIEGAVSKRLAAGAEKAMAIWRRWYALAPVPVSAALVSAESSEPQVTASFFSGGLDSFYTVLKNLGSPAGEPKVSELLFVWGLDIGLDNRELYRAVRGRLQAIADGLGLRLVLASTNLRELTDRFAAWGKHQFGAGLSSVALCLGRRLRRVYLPASYTFVHAHPWGSHPLLDPLWSTESLTVIHDGSEATRPEKARWQVGRSPLALEHLRVCFENPGNAYNCGRCEKCLRTMVNLEVAGALDLCRTFDTPLDLDRLRRLTITSPHIRINYIDSLEHLDRHGGDPELRVALDAVLAKPTPVWHRVRDRVERLDLRFLGGRLRDLARRRMIRRARPGRLAG